MKVIDKIEKLFEDSSPNPRAKYRSVSTNDLIKREQGLYKKLLDNQLNDVEGLNSIRAELKARDVKGYVSETTKDEINRQEVAQAEEQFLRAIRKVSGLVEVLPDNLISIATGDEKSVLVRVYGFAK